MVVDDKLNTICSVVVIVDDDDDDIRIASKHKTYIMDRKHQRQVTFDSNIHVKEYNATVGAYSSVNDTCPLQLAWERKL